MSEEKEKFRDLLLKGDFIKTYMEKVYPVITECFSKALKTKNYNFFLEGDEKELKIKKLFDFFNQLNNVVEDLEKTLIFIKSPDHNEISKLFPEFENTETYYNYFIENYIIRINSLSDILGKILNLLYKTEIVKPNLYLFRNKIQETIPELNKMILILSEKIKITKEKRHEKLHEGSTEFEYLKNIVFWNDLHTLMKEEAPEILKETTQKGLDEMVNIISQEIQEYVTIVRDILNFSAPKLEEYLS